MIVTLCSFDITILSKIMFGRKPCQSGCNKWVDFCFYFGVKVGNSYLFKTQIHPFIFHFSAHLGLFVVLVLLIQFLICFDMKKKLLLDSHLKIRVFNNISGKYLWLSYWIWPLVRKSCSEKTLYLFCQFSRDTPHFGMTVYHRAWGAAFSLSLHYEGALS